MKIHLKHPGILGKVIKASFYIVYHLFQRKDLFINYFYFHLLLGFFYINYLICAENFKIFKLKSEFPDFNIHMFFTINFSLIFPKKPPVSLKLLLHNTDNKMIF